MKLSRGLISGGDMRDEMGGSCDMIDGFAKWMLMDDGRLSERRDEGR